MGRAGRSGKRELLESVRRGQGARIVQRVLALLTCHAEDATLRVDAAG